MIAPSDESLREIKSQMPERMVSESERDSVSGEEVLVSAVRVEGWRVKSSPKYHPLSTKTMMLPSVLEATVKGSSAIPIERLVEVALCPSPAVAEGTMWSPAEIGPPSRLTLTGTRPERVTGTLCSSLKYASPNPPRSTPGAVETTPRSVGFLAASLLYRETKTLFSGSSMTISPAPRVRSFVG